MKEVNRISLAYELAEVRDALELVRVACDAIRDERLDTERERRSASRWCAAVANLCIERLSLVQKVISGREDARLLVAEFNEALQPNGDQENVAIAPWSPKRRRQEAADELRRYRRKKMAEAVNAPLRRRRAARD